jgi:hypothetical protein
MASTNAMTKSEPSRSVGTYRLTKYGLFALLAVNIVNVLVLFVGLEMVEFPSDFVGGPFGPLAVGPVVVNSTVAAIGGVLAYGVISRYSARPNRTFTVIAGMVLVLSFVMFLAPDLSGAPPSVFAILAIMHVTAAVIIVGILTRVTDPEVVSR